jgi:hypothetical protein
MRFIDAERRRGCEARSMSSVRLIVELSEEDPVTGWIARAGGSRESFEGLLEMLAAFDRLRSGERPTMGDDAARPPAANDG